MESAGPREVHRVSGESKHTRVRIGIITHEKYDPDRLMIYVG